MPETYEEQRIKLEQQFQVINELCGSMNHFLRETSEVLPKVQLVPKIDEDQLKIVIFVYEWISEISKNSTYPVKKVSDLNHLPGLLASLKRQEKSL